MSGLVEGQEADVGGVEGQYTGTGIEGQQGEVFKPSRNVDDQVVITNAPVEGQNHGHRPYQERYPEYSFVQDLGSDAAFPPAGPPTTLPSSFHRAGTVTTKISPN